MTSKPQERSRVRESCFQVMWCFSCFQKHENLLHSFSTQACNSFRMLDFSCVFLPRFWEDLAKCHSIFCALASTRIAKIFARDLQSRKFGSLSHNSVAVVVSTCIFKPPKTPTLSLALQNLFAEKSDPRLSHKPPPFLRLYGLHCYRIDFGFEGIVTGSPHISALSAPVKKEATENGCGCISCQNKRNRFSFGQSHERKSVQGVVPKLHAHRVELKVIAPCILLETQSSLKVIITL